LPVTSFQLVAVPMMTGAAAAGLTSLIWRWVLDIGGRPWALPVGLAAYLVLYQAISWMLPGAGRIVILGVLAFSFIAAPILFASRGVPEIYVVALFAAVGVLSFLVAWIWVARQRSGGGFSRPSVKDLVERLSNLAPRRTKPFRSAAAAHFWFEWRRSGMVLPLLVAGLLLVAIGPISWGLRFDDAASLRILIATLAMPIVLALPVGKAFSKPDFWSGDLTVPAVVAVRPLTNSDIVVIRMKVAALSAAVSWLIVLAFVSLWLSFWGDLASLPALQYPLLSILCATFLTWKFLVGNLWLGLSGRKALFTISALPYAIVPSFGLIGLALLTRHEESVFAWIRNNQDRLLPNLMAIAALALLAKLSFAVFSWRRTPPARVRRYLLFWAGTTACLVALAILLSNLAEPVLRMRNLLILIALLIMPLARIGLAQSSLARNRHR
jgi:hypothetical protein